MTDDHSLEVLRLGQFDPEQPEFYANTLSGHLEAGHRHIGRPHRHDFYATFLFTQGHGVHEIDFRTYEVRPFKVFTLAPGQAHHWDLSSDAEGIVFFHSRDYYESHYAHERLEDYPFFSVRGEPMVRLDGNGQRTLLPLFEAILETSRQDHVRKRPLLLSLVTQVYIRLEEIAGPQGQEANAVHNGYYPTFRKFMQLLERDFAREKSVAHYAGLLHITPKHLSRINRAVVGKTTTELIADRVLLEARRLLVHGAASLSHVAADLGYQDYAHFSRVFKTHTGMTPSAFAARYR